MASTEGRNSRDQDFPSLPVYTRRLLLAIERDLGKNPSTLAPAMRDLREAGGPNTFKVLFRQATAKLVTSTLQTLLGTE